MRKGRRSIALTGRQPRRPPGWRREDSHTPLSYITKSWSRRRPPLPRGRTGRVPGRTGAILHIHLHRHLSSSTPANPFKEAELHLVGAPDDGRRARLVYDLLWGRWAKPLEDPDTGDTAGIPAPVPAKPPDGAAAEVRTPAMAA